MPIRFIRCQIYSKQRILWRDVTSSWNFGSQKFGPSSSRSCKYTLIPQLFCVSHKNWLIFCIPPFLNYVKRALQKSSVTMRQKLTPIRKKNYQSIQIFLQTGNTQLKSKLNKLHFQGNSLSWLIFLVFFLSNESFQQNYFNFE